MEGGGGRDSSRELYYSSPSSSNSLGDTQRTPFGWLAVGRRIGGIGERERERERGFSRYNKKREEEKAW